MGRYSRWTDTRLAELARKQRYRFTLGFVLGIGLVLAPFGASAVLILVYGYGGLFSFGVSFVGVLAIGGIAGSCGWLVRHFRLTPTSELEWRTGQADIKVYLGEMLKAEPSVDCLVLEASSPPSTAYYLVKLRLPSDGPGTYELIHAARLWSYLEESSNKLFESEYEWCRGRLKPETDAVVRDLVARSPRGGRFELRSRVYDGLPCTFVIARTGGQDRFHFKGNLAGYREEDAGLPMVKLAEELLQLGNMEFAAYTTMWP